MSVIINGIWSKYPQPKIFFFRYCFISLLYSLLYSQISHQTMLTVYTKQCM